MKCSLIRTQTVSLKFSCLPIATIKAFRLVSTDEGLAGPLPGLVGAPPRGVAGLFAKRFRRAMTSCFDHEIRFHGNVINCKVHSRCGRTDC